MGTEIAQQVEHVAPILALSAGLVAAAFWAVRDSLVIRRRR